MPHIPHTHIPTSQSTNSELLSAITDSFSQQQSLHHYHFNYAHLLTTDQQTNGRGQHGRSWQSPTGNVYLSLYIPYLTFSKENSPHLQRLIDGRLSLCVAYQLVKMPIIQQINQQKFIKIGVKWVNDLGFYQHHTFQKLSGILIEPVNVNSQTIGAIVGIGFNINHSPILANNHEKMPYHAISLADLHPNWQYVHDLTPYYHAIQTAILQAIDQFNHFNQPKKVEQFVQDFHQVDVLWQKRLRIHSDIQPNSTIIGTAQGIDSNGCLQILSDNGKQQSIWSGNIQLDLPE